MIDFFLDQAMSLLNVASYLSEKDRKVVVNEVTFAILLTRAHIKETRKAGVDESSPMIANIWLRTANNLSAFRNAEVKSLATILIEKGKYWAQPDRYTNEMIENYNMRLDAVELSINKLAK